MEAFHICHTAAKFTDARHECDWRVLNAIPIKDWKLGGIMQQKCKQDQIFIKLLFVALWGTICPGWK